MKHVPTDFFERMPDEVRELWLDPIAALIGWPFKSLDSPLDDTWRTYFGGSSLRIINQFRWSLEIFNPVTQPLFPRDNDVQEDLIRHHIKAHPLRFPRPVETKQRFWSCVDFIRIYGVLPRPIVLCEVNGVMGVLDGVHRLAALRFLWQIEGLEVGLNLPAWVARS